MGAATSHPKTIPPSDNDYELIIRCSKALEHRLVAEQGATGQSIHEMCTSAAGRLPPALVKHLRYCATMRNKLIHEFDCVALPDRQRYLEQYSLSMAGLDELLKLQQKPHHHGAAEKPGGGCIVA